MSVSITWRLEATDIQDAVQSIAADIARRAGERRIEAERLKALDAKGRRFHGVTLEQVACKFTEAATLDSEARWLRRLTVELAVKEATS
jgi:hypothetical protein